MRKINHRNLELNISNETCCLDSRVTGYYPHHNRIVIGQMDGVDKYVILPYDRETYIPPSAIELPPSRYLTFGDPKTFDRVTLSAKSTLRALMDHSMETWYDVTTFGVTPSSQRMLIAGAVRILIYDKDLSLPITESEEFKCAIKEKRVIICSVY